MLFMSVIQRLTIALALVALVAAISFWAAS
jgi:hypothetical protein